jgi:serine protease
MDMDKFVIPSKTGVKYKVNGEVIAAGTYNAYDYDVNGTVTVTAHAKKGYVLEGQDEWSYTFTNKDCKVRADKPMFKDLCETRNDTYTIPTTEHVYYTVNGTPKDAGTYPATGTVTIIAHADEGYKIKGKTSWTYTFTNESCGGGQGGDNPVTPAAVTFNDVCATAKDTYTIPSTAGVVYKVGGNVVAAGTYSGTGTVTVMAEATSGHVLTGTATWTYDFTNVACPGGSGGGFVLGDSFTPTPAAQPQVLANTGSSSVASTLVAVFVMITALAVYAFNPKFETR